MGGMAWAFDIRKKRRADGSEVPVHWNDYTPLLIAKPKPFEFDAVVRGEERARLLRSMWETGKGDDDRDLEEDMTLFSEPLRPKVGARERRSDDLRKKEAEFDNCMVDDASSDRGSETSGPMHSTNESISSGTSDSDDV